MPPNTKTLQINPALFNPGRAKTSMNDTGTRKKKEKPSIHVQPATLRRKLIQKIKERQQRDVDPSAVNTDLITKKNDDLGSKTVSELSMGNDTEFDKSMHYMQQMMKDSSRNKAKRRLRNRAIVGGTTVQRATVSHVPVSHVPVSHVPVSHATVSHVPVSHVPVSHVPVSHVPVPHVTVPQVPVSHVPVSHVPVSHGSGQQRVSHQLKRRRTLRRAPQPHPNSQPPDVQLELPNSFVADHNPHRYMAHYTLPPRPPGPVTAHALAKTAAPPYGCLKNGSSPTYRTWQRTLRTRDLKPKIVIRDSKPNSDDILQRVRDSNKKAGERKRGKRIRRKLRTTTVKTFRLGKRGGRVGVLVKDQGTRRKIAKEYGILKRDPISKIREYCIHRGLVKVGTTAPNDVLRTLYTESILTGDVSNSSKDVMLHNFNSGGGNQQQ